MGTMATSVDSLKAKVNAAYREMYGASPEIIVAAPGRVNLIGEHTDYNEGFVLPSAIDRHVVCAVSKRRDRTMRVYALDFADQVEFSLDDRERQSASKWSNYQRGVAWALESEGFELPGMVCNWHGPYDNEFAGTSVSVVILEATHETN